jgi:SAM-dependent methyltransferase
MSAEDRQRVRAYYDEYGDAEWERLTHSAPGRVSYEVHSRVLADYVKPGDRVLEVGAGPGRFTLDLAVLGARIVVTDFSPVQLRLNAQHIGASTAETAVERRELLDITDTSRYADNEFDGVLGFGGPLSYAFDHVDDALAGLFRIVKPGGYVLASVMSLFGSWRHFLPGVVEEATMFGEEANDAVLRTGDLRYFPSAHVCLMFRASDVRSLVERTGGELLDISASNWASLADAEALEILEANPERWSRFLEHEVRACREPGALDGGTHIVFAARKPL